MIRFGFVSNSSSASFILQKSKMTPEQIWAIMYFHEGCLKYNVDDSNDGWSIRDDGEFLRGDTTMDNGAMDHLFKAIELNYAAIIDYDCDG